MKGRLANVEMATGAAVERMRNAIESVRKDLPEKDLANEKARKDMGSQSSLLGD